ncbi:MAG: glycosyltransferase family 2 protein, partial [Acidimicrobiales bacterium]
MAEGGPSIAVLVPCLNEESTIATVVRSFHEALPSSTIYVYDNNSTDRTAEVASLAGAVVRSATLRGKGNVVRRMFAYVEADVYLLVDGDATYDAGTAQELVDLVLLGGNDLVNARRVATESSSYRRGHVVGNRFLAGLVGLLFAGPVSDMLSGYKAMSRRFVKSCPVLATGFEVEAELAVSALELGVPVAETPSMYRERGAGSSSKLSTSRDGLRILATVVRLLRYGRPLLFFGTVGLVLLVAALVLGIPLLPTYMQTHKVPRFPTAILATGLVILSTLSFAVGLVLDNVTRARREARLLRYLEVAGPLRHYSVDVGASNAVASNVGASNVGAS